VEVAGTRVHDESGGLVHDHQVAILIDNVERNILSDNGIVVRWLMEHQGDSIGGPYLIVALHRTAIDMYEPRIGGFLYAVTAGMLHPHKQILVYAFRFLSLVDDKTEMLIELSTVILKFIVLYIVK
jgi:hypothetical protein